MQKKLNCLKLACLAAVLTAASTVAASAEGLDTTALTGAMTEGTGKATIVIAAGFVVMGVFIVAKIIRKGAGMI